MAYVVVAKTFHFWEFTSRKREVLCLIKEFSDSISFHDSQCAHWTICDLLLHSTIDNRCEPLTTQ